MGDRFDVWCYGCDSTLGLPVFRDVAAPLALIEHRSTLAALSRVGQLGLETGGCSVSLAWFEAHHRHDLVVCDEHHHVVQRPPPGGTGAQFTLVCTCPSRPRHVPGCPHHALDARS